MNSRVLDQPGQQTDFPPRKRKKERGEERRRRKKEKGKKEKKGRLAVMSEL